MGIDSKGSFFYSELESKRFNMNIVRGNAEKINIKEIQKSIYNNLTDVMFLRIPSIQSFEINELSKLGFEYFQTDTLVYYIVDFDKYEIKALRNAELEFVKAKNSDRGLLRTMVEVIFSGYTNHYFSNPYLPKEDILEGYIEWVVNFIDDDTKEVFLVYREGEAIAFATCSLDNGIAEGVLYGVMPNSSGGGVYSDIIRFTQKYYFDKGVKLMKVSTQVQNYAVQKVWSREGFYMNESFSTIHINSLLNFSLEGKREFEYQVTEEDIENYATASKDFNEIHFDLEAAQKAGFKDRIAHGLLATGEISRIIGTEYPGVGSIFMNYKNIFLAPMFINETYKFEVSTPYKNAKGIYICVVKVFDQNSKLTVVSYNQVLKR
ncbi:MaoC family dehydratase N-terminal domain-containing protein [Myroides odoratimimus]|uniref:GNAT family N-acetyltransferase n=1 Tax=Myroides odoratimimus TaxID=76832 RepID=UPI0025758D0D|nr:GNAT family N-acetyltransferase [Myroides odoratimimus]MDM1527402.1 MaoC family dehydratase N-terminal domain-containing protein [Myroides odoratimimus]